MLFLLYVAVKNWYKEMKTEDQGCLQAFKKGTGYNRSKAFLEDCNQQTIEVAASSAVQLQ